MSKPGKQTARIAKQKKLVPGQGAMKRKPKHTRTGSVKHRRSFRKFVGGLFRKGKD